MENIVESTMWSKSLLQSWSMPMPRSVIIFFVTPQKKLNLPLPFQKRPKRILLKIGITNIFRFKTSSFPCKSQLRYCYLKSEKINHLSGHYQLK